MRYAVRIIEHAKRHLPSGSYARVIVRVFDEEFEAPTKQAARKMARTKYPDAFRYSFGPVWLRKPEAVAA